MKKNKKIILLIAIIILIVIITSITVVITTKNSKEKNNKEKAEKETESEIELEETYKNYLEAKDDILKTKDKPTTIYEEKDGDYVFLNEDGEEIAREEYEEVCENSNKVEIDGKIREIRAAKKDGSYFFIDSQGERLFDVVENVKNVAELWAKFESCVYQKEGMIKEQENKEEINIEKKELYLEEKHYAKDKNNSNYSEFEEGEEDREILTYYYFENNEITDKILQVVTIDEERDETIFDKLSEETDSNINSEFYMVKNEYYLIDIKTKEKIKLECDNLFFLLDYYEEDDYFIDKVFLYSDGSIPYYDKSSSGYFDINTGEKIVSDNNQIIMEVDENYQYIYDINEEKSLIKDKNTNEIEREYENTFINVYENFLTIEGKEDTLIIDKNLNEKFISNAELYIRIHRNLMTISEEIAEGENYLYKIENNNLIEVSQLEYPNLYINYAKEKIKEPESMSIYITTGIIDKF